MDDFSQAQKLFAEYQRTRNDDTLIEALDILDELLLGDDRKRVENLKGTIERFLNNELKNIMEKYNIRDFETPENDVLSLLSGSASEDDLEKVSSILRIVILGRDGHL